MKGLDIDRERSERKISCADFLKAYNAGLPERFPRASPVLLEEYRNAYQSQFKDGLWSLDLHRKKFMDWLPAHLKSLEPRLTARAAGGTLKPSTSAEPQK